MSQVFPHHILILKKIYKAFGFLNQNMTGEDQRHTQTCVLGTETHVYACPSSSPSCFDKNNQMLYQMVFVKT